MADENKQLVASSEFDPTNFIKGIDAMTASLEKLSAQEDQITQDMLNVNNALKENRTALKATQDQMIALDKTSKTYAEDLAKLNAQQKTLKDQQTALQTTLKGQKDALAQVNKSANDYRAALQNIATTARQVSQETKGRTIFDVGSLNKQVQDVVATTSRLRGIFQGKIDTQELEQFEQAIAGTTDEMQQLAQVIEFVKSKLDTLDPDSQEFADLTRVVETGEQVLDQFNKTVENTGKGSQSLRGRLAALRTELVKLEDQGKENTQEFQDLQIEAGKLQDAIGDAQARIKVLSSDTRALDFGIGAIRGVASAFGVAEGAAALFDIKNEDVMESIQRLNAIMLILNGLQEIQNLLQKQSVVFIVGQQIATKAAAVAQGIYAAAVGTSTGAMRAFRLALLATGVGAFIVLIGSLVEVMSSLGDETDEATLSMNEFDDAVELVQIRLKTFNDVQKRDAAIAEERLKRQGANEKKFFDLRINNLQTERNETKKALDDIRAIQDNFLNRGGADSEFIENTNQEATRLFNRLREIDDTIAVEREREQTRQFEAARKNAEKQAELYRAYLDRLTQLQRELRDKTLDAQTQDEGAIRQALKNQLSDLTNDIDAEVKSGKLTKVRGAALKELIKKINKVDLDKALKEFNEQVAQAQLEQDRQIFDLRLQNAEQRAGLLADVAERERAQLRIADERARQDLENDLADTLAAIQQTADQGLISPAQAQTNADNVRAIYTQLLENLAAQTQQKAGELAANIFQRGQEEISRTFRDIGLSISQAATAEILQLTQQYTSGAITYDRYQKELTRIAAEESKKRIEQQIQENTVLLQGVLIRQQREQDPDRQKALQDQETQLRQQLSDLRRQLAGAEAQDTQQQDADQKARIGRIASYAQAIGQVTSQVVAFWQAANQAEQDALERSITLQERRVEAATRIAERGNAEYLRLEEDRLNELQVKQENAARRQIAINAVLQTSQALTAFVTALAQGIATGGPLGGIAIAGAVIGLLASGYAIISSLQQRNQPTFFKGTKSVKRENGEPAGRDTIPARVNEGEAIIPTDTNREYAPAVAAIYDRTIPAEDMNAFVNSYRTNSRVIPRLDHDRISEAAGVVVTYDGQLLEATQEQNRLLSENNDRLALVEKRLKNMGITATVDKNGIAISLMKAVEQFKIDKNS